MGTSAWLIVGDFGHICGMAASARNAVDEVKMAVIGTEELACFAAKSNPDRLYWFEAGENLPAEAFSQDVARMIQNDQPQVILSLDDPISRVIWAEAAVKTDAAVVGTLFDVTCSGEVKQAKRLVADDRSVRIVETKKILAGIFNGDDAEPEGSQAEIIRGDGDGRMRQIRFAEGDKQEPAGKSGLKSADRVIGVGYGVGSKADLEMVNRFAEGMKAQVGCSLPVAKQLLWFDEDRVIGITHNRIAPELYIALGVSGQPQHMSGVRDAKVVVSINTDPDAPIFKKCDYGIVGDVSEFLPVLVEKASVHNS